MRELSLRVSLEALLPLMAVLLLGTLVSCGSEKHGLSIVIHDEEDEGASGIKISQVGIEAPLGVTDERGASEVQIVRRRGANVRLQLESPKKKDRPVYAFDPPEGDVQVSDDDIAGGFKRIYVRRTDREAGLAESDSTATLRIVSIPPGGRVLVGGVERGVTPFFVEDLPVDEKIKVEVRMQGYHPWSKDLLLFSGENLDTAVLQTIEVTTAALDVDSRPEGAAIYIDGSRTQKITPASFEGLRMGRHSVRLEQDGYRNLETSITLKPGERSVVSRILESVEPDIPKPPREEKGQSVKVTYSISTRPYAEVRVDDDPVNRNITNHFPLSLPLGQHVLHVRMNDQVWDVPFEVRSGDTDTIVTLDVTKREVRRRGAR